MEAEMRCLSELCLFYSRHPGIMDTAAEVEL